MFVSRVHLTSQRFFKALKFIQSKFKAKTGSFVIWCDQVLMYIRPA